MLYIVSLAIIFVSRFQQHVSGSAKLTSDLKAAVFTIAMANGDEETFDQLVKVCGCGCGCVHIYNLNHV